jgi:3-oxoacyl-[acyl-carrier protein] reductase
MNFEGKTILIVGGSSGIGLSLVQTLHQKKANVYVVSRTVSTEWPDRVNSLQADVTKDLDTVEAFLPEQLHGLVYAVGSITLKPFNRLSAEDFLNDYQLNVLGAMRTTQIALKALKNAGNSSIVFISSVAAKIGLPYHASIAAAKGGVEGMAISLSAELASLKIRVNVVSPSLTNTSLAEKLLNSPEKQEASAKRHPLGRYGQPEDISNSIAFLLSDQSSWMTGQVIGIDGGMGNLKTT